MKHHYYDDRENDEVVVNCEMIEAGLDVLASNYLDLMSALRSPLDVSYSYPKSRSKKLLNGRWGHG